jgi:formylmethanofuran dehydrogenase subunit E
MANEQNYYMVLLHNDNAVSEKLACTKCHNDDMDTLQIDDNDNVTCLDCGNKYQV